MPVMALTVSEGFVSERALKFSTNSPYIPKARSGSMRPFDEASFDMRELGEAW
jgi:hypothetical protein